MVLFREQVHETPAMPKKGARKKRYQRGFHQGKPTIFASSFHVGRAHRFGLACMGGFFSILKYTRSNKYPIQEDNASAYQYAQKESTTGYHREDGSSEHHGLTADSNNPAAAPPIEISSGMILCGCPRT
jgi:hypothetical protein